MKLKNHQKDNFISSIRMPYEITFSKWIEAIQAPLILMSQAELENCAMD